MQNDLFWLGLIKIATEEADCLIFVIYIVHSATQFHLMEEYKSCWIMKEKCYSILISVVEIWDCRQQRTTVSLNIVLLNKSFHSPLNWQAHWMAHWSFIEIVFDLLQWEDGRVNKKEEEYFPALWFECNLCFFGSRCQSFYCLYLINLIKKTMGGCVKYHAKA